MAFTILPFSTYVGVATVPFFWGIAASLALSPGHGVLLVISGFLVTITLLYPAFAFRSVSQGYRARLGRRGIARFLILVLLAFSPIGGWLASAWMWLPHFFWYFAPVAGLVWAWLNTDMLGFVGRVMHRKWWQILNMLLFLPAMLIAALAAGGVLSLFMVIFHREAAPLLPAACVIAAVSVLLNLATRLIAGDTLIRMNDATQLVAELKENPVSVSRSLAVWAAWNARRRGRPDVVMIHMLIGLHVTGSRTGSFGRKASVLRMRTDLGDGRRALQLADAALAALAATKLPGAQRVLASREFVFAKGQVEQNKAVLADEQTRYDEALSHYRAAARTYAQGGMRNHAALAAACESGLDALFYRSPAARSELRRLSSDREIAPVVRRTAYAYELLFASLVDEQDRAEIQRRVERIRAELPVAPGSRQLRDEAPHSASLRGILSDYEQNILRVAEQSEEMALGERQDMESSVPFLDGRRELEPALILREADAAADRKDWAAAGALAAEAARLAIDRDRPINLINACLTLAHSAARQGRWTAAYTFLETAMGTDELMRESTVSADRRVESRGVLPDVHNSAIWMVLRGAAEGAPFEHPVATALAIVERSRSRALLDLMGEAGTPRLAVTPGLAGLVEQETAATTAMRAAREAWIVAKGTADEALAWQGLAKARNRLDEIRDQIRATGPDGERYLDVRLGSPLPYLEIRALLDPAVEAA